MNDEELKNRVESSSGLRRVRAALCDEVAFRADGPARLDPITILTIISIVIQVITHCRNKNSDEDIVQAIRNAKTLPRRRLALLRRRLNNLPEDVYASIGDPQPVYDTLLDMGENLSDDEIEELLRLSRECDN